MKKVYTAENVAEAHVVRSALEFAGIEAVVQNDQVYGLRGAVPLTPETLPEVWIVKDEQFDQAQQVILEKLPLESTDLESDANEVALESVNENSEDDSQVRELSTPARWALRLTILFVCFYSGILFERLILTSRNLDFNGDGTPDQIWRSDADLSWELLSDSNFDGQANIHTKFSAFGVPKEQSIDLDFDGEFETKVTYKNGFPIQSVVHAPNGGTLVRETYKHGILVESLVDEDDDGEIDVRLVYDCYGRVTKREPL